MSARPRGRRGERQASHYADQINVNLCLASTSRCRSAKKESHQSPAMINRHLLTFCCENVARLQPPDATCFSAYKTNRTATNYSDEWEFINQYDKRTSRVLSLLHCCLETCLSGESLRPKQRSRYTKEKLSINYLCAKVFWLHLINNKL